MKRFANERVAGLMERLGLDDDVAIESRLVSKTIESAQSRVEGFNFDMRKRVVEFDDVINRQRETIYAERDKVLRNEDLTETIRGFLEDEIESLVETHLAGENVDDWAMEALVAGLRAMGLEGSGATEEELWELGGRDAIADHLVELADARLEAREAEVGAADWAMVERLVLLRTIDSLWVEHLTEVDDTRRGIGLRGYAQQDPLNEFRREAYRLYEELRGLIRHQVASTIFRVTVTRQQQQPLAPVAAAAAAAVPAASATSAGSAGRARADRGGRALGSGVASGLAPDPMANAREVSGATPGAAPGQARPGFTPSGARIGRNDPCWCGSGLKYKKCHGR
jgi:preprotein translocase subunit SecA